MSLFIQMAGTGSAFAKKYYNNNALIYCNHYCLMIDFGITAPTALYAMNKSFDEIDGFLITHMHADHVGGLEELAFQMRYLFGRKPVLHIPLPLIEPLWNHTLKGGLENEAEGLTKLDDFFRIIPIEEKKPRVISPGLTVEMIRTPHIPGKPSFSLIINDDLFYSADVVFNRELLDYVHASRQCRYILHDCQLMSPGVVHAALDELLTLSEDLQLKIHLMHYGDDMESFIGRTGHMTFLRQHKLYDFT